MLDSQFFVVSIARSLHVNLSPQRIRPDSYSIVRRRLPICPATMLADGRTCGGCAPHLDEGALNANGHEPR